MRTNTKSRKVWKKIFALLPQKQKLEFFLVLAILAVSAVFSQLTPLAVGYLTDHVLAAETATFQSVLPILLVILAVNVVNEIIKVIRRLIVEDAATQAEKNARQRAALSLLMAPLSYFRGHMTGNIHGRLNRSLDGSLPGHTGDSRGDFHRLSPDQHPERHPGGADGDQSRHGRYDG